MDEDTESPNNVIEYSIMTADPDNAFEINTDTGEIMLKPFIKSMAIVQNITKEKECRWSLVVQARDRGSPSFSTTAVVNIDITEAVRPDFPHSITAALFMPRLSLKPVRSRSFSNYAAANSASSFQLHLLCRFLKDNSAD